MTKPDLAGLNAVALQAMREALVIANVDADPNMISVAKHKSAAWHDRLANTLVNEFRAGRLVQIDRIEAADAENARLREALRKIAPMVDWMPHPHCVSAEQIIRHALGGEHE